jgi:pilus assembly protein FimV
MGDTVNMPRDEVTAEHLRSGIGADETGEDATLSLSPADLSEDLNEARTMTEVGTKLDLARAYVDMGDPSGARSILEEVLQEGDQQQRQQAQQLLDTLPG